VKLKRALVTGITGQDGSYLARLLLKKGYEVHGIIRRSSSFNTARIEDLYRDPHDPGAALRLYFGDMTDAGSLSRVLRETKPDEVYNLAAQSHVRVSFDIPEFTRNTNGAGTRSLLQAIVENGLKPKFYQASSSEQFGNSPVPQNEQTPFNPQSPYAESKVEAFETTQQYRKKYSLFACNGILFNHESEQRGETFVTRKITRAATRIKLKLQDTLYLGNLEAKRDWGYAPEYVEAMWQILQQDRPDDYVIATGETHSVREFMEEAFGLLDLDWKKHVKIDPKYFRPAEVDLLIGDSSKARKQFDWKPKVTFRKLVRLMVKADLELAERDFHAKNFRKQNPRQPAEVKSR